jgi:hypothetical protein
MRETYRSPWFNLEGYLACTVKYEDGTRRTVLQHREIMEAHIGRRLKRWEVVHHRDEDKRNNSLDNLELTTRPEHSRHHRPEIEYVELECGLCGTQFTKEARNERRRTKKGMAGPFCGKSCAGKFHRAKQIAAGQVNLRR